MTSNVDRQPVQFRLARTNQRKLPDCNDLVHSIIILKLNITIKIHGQNTPLQSIDAFSEQCPHFELVRFVPATLMCCPATTRSLGCVVAIKFYMCAIIKHALAKFGEFSWTVPVSRVMWTGCIYMSSPIATDFMMARSVRLSHVLCEYLFFTLIKQAVSFDAAMSMRRWALSHLEYRGSNRPSYAFVAWAQASRDWRGYKRKILASMRSWVRRC